MHMICFDKMDLGESVGNNHYIMLDDWKIDIFTLSSVYKGTPFSTNHSVKTVEIIGLFENIYTSFTTYTDVALTTHLAFGKPYNDTKFTAQVFTQPSVA